MKNNNNGEAYPLPLMRNFNNNGEAYPLPLKSITRINEGNETTRGQHLGRVATMARQYNKRVSALKRQANSPAARKAAIKEMVRRAIVNAARNKRKTGKKH